MKEFWKSKRLKGLIAVLLLLFGMMLFSAFRGGKAGFSEGMLGYAAVPIQKAGASAVQAAGSFLDRFTKYDRLLQEKQSLQKEVDDLRQKLLDYESMKRENEQLKNMMGMKQENPDYQFVQAAVIGRDPDHRNESFTIDQGSFKGVSLHDPVVTSSGLVGFIEEVGPSYSVVTTLFSPKIKVGAYESKSGQLGVVSGDLTLSEKGMCRMQYMQQRGTVNELVATSGSSGIYPKGLMIGTIREVERENGGASYNAVIEPSNRMEELTTVFVITDFLGQINSADGESN